METLFKLRWRDPLDGTVHQARGYELREEQHVFVGRDLLTYCGIGLGSLPIREVSFEPLTCPLCRAGDWLTGHLAGLPGEPGRGGGELAQTDPELERIAEEAQREAHSAASGLAVVFGIGAVFLGVAALILLLR